MKARRNIESWPGINQHQCLWRNLNYRLAIEKYQLGNIVMKWRSW